MDLVAGDHIDFSVLLPSDAATVGINEVLLRACAEDPTAPTPEDAGFAEGEAGTAVAPVDEVQEELPVEEEEGLQEGC